MLVEEADDFSLELTPYDEVAAATFSLAAIVFAGVSFNHFLPRLLEARVTGRE